MISFYLFLIIDFFFRTLPRTHPPFPQSSPHSVKSVNQPSSLVEASQSVSHPTGPAHQFTITSQSGLERAASTCRYSSASRRAELSRACGLLRHCRQQCRFTASTASTASLCTHSPDCEQSNCKCNYRSFIPVTSSCPLPRYSSRPINRNRPRTVPPYSLSVPKILPAGSRSTENEYWCNTSFLVRPRKKKGPYR